MDGREASDPFADRGGLARSSARVALVAQASFLVIVAALHALRPELDPSWRLVSEYATGPYGALMVVAFGLSALGCLALVPAIGGPARSRIGAIGAAILVLSALGLVVAALFPTDPITTTPADLSAIGRLHMAGAGLGMAAFPVAALLLSASLVRRGWFRPLRPALWLLTAAVWAALAAMVPPLARALASGFGPDVAIGWPHRLLLLADSAWVLTVAGFVARRRSASGARSAVGTDS